MKLQCFDIRLAQQHLDHVASWHSLSTSAIGRVVSRLVLANGLPQSSNLAAQAIQLILQAKVQTKSVQGHQTQSVKVQEARTHEGA